MKVRIYKSRDGWRWRLLAGNNRIVAESGEGYNRRSHCLRMWRNIAYKAPVARIMEDL